MFEKIQENKKLSKDEIAEFEKVKSRFNQLCSLANELDVKLYFDAEESWIQNALDDLVEEFKTIFGKTVTFIAQSKGKSTLNKGIDKAVKGIGKAINYAVSSTPVVKM